MVSFHLTVIAVRERGGGPGNSQKGSSPEKQPCSNKERIAGVCLSIGGVPPKEQLLMVISILNKAATGSMVCLMSLF